MSFADLARELGVSPSTARRWTADIRLTDLQLIAQRSAVAETARQASATMAARARANRFRWRAEGAAHARRGSSLHLAGCLLYWAEGTKARTNLEITNSDPHLLRLFAEFLRCEMNVGSSRMTFRLHIYEGNGLTVEAIEEFWLNHLSLPRSSLRRHTFNRRPAPQSGRTRNKLPYGVGTLRVTRSTPLVQHIYGAIETYGGIHPTGTFAI